MICHLNALRHWYPFMLKGFVRVELHHRLCRDPPRLSRKDVLPGILWLAKHMQVFPHSSRCAVSFLHSTFVACSCYGSVLSSCLHVWTFLLTKTFSGCQSLHACFISHQLWSFVVDLVRVSHGLLTWPGKPIGTL